jgi:hypothetical protein
VSATPPLRSQRPGFPGYLAPDDGQPDENPDNNCNWACYSAAIQALGGPAVPPDHLKDHDHLYGQGQMGPSYDGNNRYEDTTYGVVQTLKTLSGAARESDIKAQLAAGNYVQVLIPSDWNNPVPNSSSSHYVLLYRDDGAGNFWAMNPWDGTMMGRTYARWALLDARGGDYLIYSKGATVTFDASQYTKQADGSYKHANGVIVGSGDYAFLAANGINTPPIYGEIARPGSSSNETYLPLGDSGSELGYVYWSGSNAYLNYWGGHGMVSLEVSRKVERDGRMQALAGLADMTQQRDAARSLLTDMTAQRDAVNAKLADLQAAYEMATQQSAAKDGQIQQLQAQVADLTAKLAAGDPQSQDAKADLEQLRSYFAKYPAPQAPAA